MSTPPTTLHALLGGCGPALGSVRRVPTNARPAKGWLNIDPEHVSHWEDFTLANLRLAFGDILNQAPPSDYVAPRFAPTPYSIRHVSDVKCMAKEHLESLLRGPIANGAAVLGKRMRRVFSAISIGRKSVV